MFALVVGPLRVLLLLHLVLVELKVPRYRFSAREVAQVELVDTPKQLEHLAQDLVPLIQAAQALDDHNCGEDAAVVSTKPAEQEALQSGGASVSNCSGTIGTPQTSQASIHTQDGKNDEEGQPSSRDQPFSEQTCSHQQGTGDQLIGRQLRIMQDFPRRDVSMDQTSKWWVSSATQTAKRLDHGNHKRKWDDQQKHPKLSTCDVEQSLHVSHLTEVDVPHPESRGVLDGEIRQNRDQSLDQKLDEWRCKWQLLTCSPLRFPDKGLARKGSGMSPRASPTPVSSGHTFNCDRHDVQPENESRAMVSGKRVGEEVNPCDSWCAAEREQQVPKEMNGDASPKSFPDSAELAESLIYKVNSA